MLMIVMMRALLVALVVVCCAQMCAAGDAIYRRPRFLGRSMRATAPQTLTAPPAYETRYFEARVDNFNAHVQPRTFKMRYLINTSHFDAEKGVLFFYTGNEGDIELFAANTGLVWQWAPEFRAAVVFAEHRYYGESLPFGNESFVGANPGYLSVAQVLSDYAALIESLQLELQTKSSIRIPVIAFGGSYGGMLSAWFRVRYPHIVDGALAASAPILQFENVTDSRVFNALVTKDYRDHALRQRRVGGVDTCDAAWSAALLSIQAANATPAAWPSLSSTFSLCAPLQSAANVTTLVNWLSSGLVDQAMTDYPAPTSFLQPIPAWPVNVSCRVFDQCLTTDGDALIACAAQAIQIYYNGSGTTQCNDILSDATADLGEQGWDYQSCTEMVMPIGQSGLPTDMFVPAPWSDAAFVEYCAQKWGVQPDFGWAVREFGGASLRASSNIIFSNGLLDPWRGGGVQTSLSDTLVAITIAEGAHHLDLRASDPSDPVYVRAARAQEQALVQQFIDEARSAR